MSPIYDQWAKFYDLAEGDRSVFINFYSTLITSETRSLLEFGCGTGVITTALAQCMARHHDGYAGLRVVGLDESAEMLRIARDRDRRIEWVLGDFRLPPVGGEYDLVICCFNVLQMMLDEQDVSAVFRAAREHLKHDGSFAFDLYQPNLAYLSNPQTNRLVRALTDNSGRMFELREDFVYDPPSRILTFDWRLIEPSNPGSPLATMPAQQIRQYFASDVERLLTDAGLVIKERYGDFDRSPFTGTSKKQILICGRSALK